MGCWVIFVRFVTGLRVCLCYCAVFIFVFVRKREETEAVHSHAGLLVLLSLQQKGNMKELPQGAAFWTFRSEIFLVFEYMNGIGCTAGSGNCFQNHQTGLFVISFSAFLILFQQLSLLIKKERKTCHDVLSDQSKVTVMAGNGGMDNSGLIQVGGGGGVDTDRSSAFFVGTIRYWSWQYLWWLLLDQWLASFILDCVAVRLPLIWSVIMKSPASSLLACWFSCVFSLSFFFFFSWKQHAWLRNLSIYTLWRFT